MKNELYKLIHNDYFETSNDFKQFLNWLSNEFVLYQQEDINGLKVFFPNGYFFINELNHNKNSIQLRIEVKSKCLKNGTQIFNQIKSILNHSKIFQTQKLQLAV
tara:strand:- start:59 stop:370 length:312 start_codon:yes stop_codon:yes gene_type:complete